MLQARTQAFRLIRVETFFTYTFYFVNIFPHHTWSFLKLCEHIFALPSLTQVRVLQAVVKDKDVRFQEQIQKHEEELLQLNTQASNDAELQQVFFLIYFLFFKQKPKNEVGWTYL